MGGEEKKNRFYRVNSPTAPPILFQGHVTREFSALHNNIVEEIYTSFPEFLGVLCPSSLNMHPYFDGVKKKWTRDPFDFFIVT